MLPPQNPVPDDHSLVIRCRAGDASAWQIVVHRYQRVVHSIARRAGLDQDAAADVFQTVFLRLYENLNRLSDPARLQAWILTTAKRESWLQRKRSDLSVSLTHSDSEDSDEEPFDLLDDAVGPQDTVDRWQQLTQVQLGMEKLDERCRALLMALFGDEGSPYEDIVARLGMPIGSIGPTRARCLTKLRRLIE